MKTMHRLVSIAFAALLTTSMLAGIQLLAQHDAPAPQMALASTARA